MSNQDTSQYVYSFNGFVYEDPFLVARLTEERPSKLTVSNSAGMSGKRIGENFQDILRLAVEGEIAELPEDDPNVLLLRQLLQRFRYAHRAEVGKAKLYLNSAADGRPAEFVWAAVENVTGIVWEDPLNSTKFDITFTAEPEFWYDDPQTVDLLQNQDVDGVETTYTQTINYAGPVDDFFADAEGLPKLTFTVKDLDETKLGTNDPPKITITNAQDEQEFILYPQGDDIFHIDSYEETIRYFPSLASTAQVYEFADYDQFIYLVAAALDAGVDNDFTIVCRHCDLDVAEALYYPRHW